MKPKFPFGFPQIGEEEIQAAVAVLRSGWLAHGPRVKAFEQAFAAYLGVKHAVCVSSCTAALHLSLLALGIGPGDEVIVPAQTHVATAHAALFVGAKPVFADIDPQTFNISLDSILRCLTPKTKAIHAVHFAGLPCDMDGILEIARERGISVVEDCAHALGARLNGRPVGTFGETGCFSFYPIKHITTTEGGMLVTNSDEIAEKASKQRAFGIDVEAYDRDKPGVYDTPLLGFNYRMTDVEAAIGLAQLKKAEPMIKRRIANASALSSELENVPGIRLPSCPPGRRHAYLFYQLWLGEDFPLSRDAFAQHLKQNGVGTSIYYALPVHLMSFYRKKYGTKEGACPVAEEAAARTLALPVHPQLGNKEMAHIAGLIKAAARDEK